MLTHVPNGGARTPAEGAILKAMGVRAGFPDLILPAARRGYIGLAIEMKRPGEKPRANQTDWHIRLTDEGWLVETHDSSSTAFDRIQWYVSDPIRRVLTETA